MYNITSHGVPDVARGILKNRLYEDFVLHILFAYVTPRVPMGFFKNISPFGPCCLAIYMSEELYYIDVIRISLVYAAV